MSNMNKHFPKRDSFLRLDFLYQASHLLVNQMKLENSKANKDSSSFGKGSSNLLKFYGESFASICKRNVLKVHPEVKRSLCKRCKSLLVPGVTAQFRSTSKKSKEKKVMVHCLGCKFCKSYPINSHHCLWLEHQQSLHSYGASCDNKPSNDVMARGVEKLKRCGDVVAEQKNKKKYKNSEEKLDLEATFLHEPKEQEKQKIKSSSSTDIPNSCSTSSNPDATLEPN